jgi:hypothetical protein
MDLKEILPEYVGNQEDLDESSVAMEPWEFVYHLSEYQLLKE